MILKESDLMVIDWHARKGAPDNLILDFLLIGRLYCPTSVESRETLTYVGGPLYPSKGTPHQMEIKLKLLMGQVWVET